MVKFFWIFLLLITAVLSGDLLYLYYAGAWYDPIKVVEISEIVSLRLICASSLIVAIYLIRKAIGAK